jgi:hypothetical protein
LVFFIKLHNHPLGLDELGNVRASHQALVGSDDHRVTPLFHQLNARQTWHETGDPDKVFAVILEVMLHLLNVAFDFARAFKPNRYDLSSIDDK